MHRIINFLLTICFSVDSQQEEYTLCEHCIHDNVLVTAINFCKTCEDPEALCEICAKHHTRQKAFKDHELCGIMHEFSKHHSNKRYVWHFTTWFNTGFFVKLLNKKYICTEQQNVL